MRSPVRGSASSLAAVLLFGLVVQDHRKGKRLPVDGEWEKYIIHWEIIGPCGFLFLGSCARLLPSSTRHFLPERVFWSSPTALISTKSLSQNMCTKGTYSPASSLCQRIATLSSKSLRTFRSLKKKSEVTKLEFLKVDLGPHSLNFCCPKLLIIRVHVLLKLATAHFPSGGFQEATTLNPKGG